MRKQERGERARMEGGQSDRAHLHQVLDNGFVEEGLGHAVAERLVQSDFGAGRLQQGTEATDCGQRERERESNT